MDKTQAQTSVKKLQSEISDLSPSALIELFQIDVGVLADDRQIAINDSERVFCFHNSVKLTTTDIYFQGIKYVLAPIQAQGFEYSSRGPLPTPTLAMTVNDASIPMLALLKNMVRFFGDIIGAKVTRKRTFAKFLDITTFPNGLPNGFEPDQFVEFPPDIYFVNRKSRENKFSIEYELNSVLDLEGVNIPRRPIIARTCPFTYRGAGCIYEANSRRNDDIHGESTIMPTSAPAIATDEDKLITDLLGVPSLTDMGKYQPGSTYQKGQVVYLNFAGVNYYFVAKQNNVVVGPLDTNFWVQDKCSKQQKGCKIHWGIDGSVNVSNTSLVKGELPFGGFASTERLTRPNG